MTDEEESRQILKQALKLANEAISIDSHSHSQDKVKVAASYERVVEMLRSPALTAFLEGMEYEKDKIEGLIRVYSERISELSHLDPGQDDVAVPPPPAPLVEVEAKGSIDKLSSSIAEISLNEWTFANHRRNLNVSRFYLEKCPPSTEKRAFWLMRLLATCFNTGGFLSERLYVPKDMWMHMASRYSGKELQMAAYKRVSSRLGELSLVDLSDTQLVQRELADFEEMLYGIQKQFMKKFKYLQESAVLTSNKKLVVDLDVPEKGRSVDEYLASLETMLDAPQFLDDWITYFSTKPDMTGINDSLVRISDFLLKIVCGVIMNELQINLTAYVKFYRDEFMTV